MTTIGIIGSGNVGTSLAKAAIAHGCDVVLSNSRGPHSLAALVADLGPNARAATPEEAAAAGACPGRRRPGGQAPRRLALRAKRWQGS